MITITAETKKMDNKVDIEKLIEEAYALATEKGFHKTKRPHEELLMLVISEIGELLESHRTNNFTKWYEYDAIMRGDKKMIYPSIDFYRTNREKALLEYKNETFRQFIKDSVEDECADIVIRLCDYAGVKKLNSENIALDVETNLLDLKNIIVDNLGKYLLNVTRSIIDISGNDFREGRYVSVAIAKMIHLCNEMNVDLVKHIALKMEYNKSRSRLHGKAY